jgi:acetyl-CoA carboxylase carboxyl transferase subunit alpha
MREAAEALRLTAQDLKALEVVDRVIPEPLGGAHRDPEASYRAVGVAISEMLAEMKDMDAKALIKDRRQKFLDIGSKGLAA